jgi:hypothetical protein
VEAIVNGGPIQKEIVGTVVRIDNSGIGPNSGEITLVIVPENSAAVVEVFAGIMDSGQSQHGIENGVYAAFLNMALAALTTGRKLRVSYIEADKPRFYSMTILA